MDSTQGQNDGIFKFQTRHTSQDHNNKQKNIRQSDDILEISIVEQDRRGKIAKQYLYVERMKN